MNGKHFVMAHLIVLILLIVAFTPISSQQAGSYDPWLDSNDDGRINYKELYKLATSFGSSGTPINKTALLLELQSKVDSLNATVIEQQIQISELQAQIQRMPKVITNDVYQKEIPSNHWDDIVSISVPVSEGANVIAIASIDSVGGLFFRFRANDTYGQHYCSNIEGLHSAWINLPLGTYTFALQGYGTGLSATYVVYARLTLIIS